MKEHLYQLAIKWTGNTGSGTLDYRSYERSYTIQAENKVGIFASSDPVFRGDKTKYNPEELLLASLSGCHMLWFLHLCAESGIVITDYIDNPVGILSETENGGGRFKEVILNPVVTIENIDLAGKIDELHQKANELCFIANSVNFKVKHNATIR
ncbi:MAG: OsmC family protein [Bacteroidales bacterium]|nr:OsmC family protein [Bacteroidales bacterium]